eukprot:CAMPEP_0184652154 /NCGR_PEP_ID=MMETSP0308-20130426/9847_1 /TAXON_ID=38269 /ORGANISM="Gloeochaete witrockiana, Strain SAG 46.84" /LENGTH=658 /DNA_ID=CAMNT_0027086861 /DNA_START=26 /DNA_END=1998 /DNA_ORIENTATION=+
MGLGLAKLVDTYFDVLKGEGQYRRLLFSEDIDFDGNVTLDVLLDGTRSMSEVSRKFSELNAEVLAEIPSYADGILGVHMPISMVPRASQLPGVFSMLLGQEPEFSSEFSTKPSIGTMQMERLNSKYDGTGVTLAVLSSSYDAMNAAKADVKKGNLPGQGNPHGHKQPVFVLDDLKTFTSGNDEGRAMLQVVHSIAPKSKLCFCTGYKRKSITLFAKRIVDLAGPPCNAKIMIDDVGYPDNPFIEAVSANSVEAIYRKGVFYFSAAGNRRIYTREFRMEMVPHSDPSVPPQLNAVPGIESWTKFPEDMKPEWNGFGAPITSGPKPLKLYLWWNQPVKNVRDNIEMYIFFENRTLHVAGVDDNQRTGLAQEVVDVADGGPFFIAIGKRKSIRRPASAADSDKYPPLYAHLRVRKSHYAKVWPPASKAYPAVTGQTVARHAFAVCAYEYWNLTVPARYSPSGPATLFWDSQGRLISTEGEIRLKPDICGVTCTPNTFFAVGRDRDKDGLPNFCGTSGASPNLGALVALLVQAKPSITYSELLDLFKKTASNRGVWDPISGYGLVNGDLALCELLGKGTECASILAPKQKEQETSSSDGSTKKEEQEPSSEVSKTGDMGKEELTDGTTVKKDENSASEEGKGSGTPGEGDEAGEGKDKEGKG